MLRCPRSILITHRIAKGTLLLSNGYTNLIRWLDKLILIIFTIIDITATSIPWARYTLAINLGLIPDHKLRSDPSL